MSNPVVNVQVSVLSAPTPSTLQRKLALLSQGATNTSQGTITFLSQFSDLAAILKGALALSSVSWSGSIATATTASPHGLTGTFPVTIVGASVSGYNGTFTATVTGASTFTYPLAVNPGGTASGGTYTPEDVSELVAMATTFFAQGNGPGCYVLECGIGDASAGTTFLTAWMSQNTDTFYGFVIPRYWDGAASYLAFVANFNATTSKVYFFTTTTLQNYLLYPATDKCVVAMIEAPAYGTWPANALFSTPSQTGGVATATTTTPHGVAVGQWFQLAGNLPSGWNGWFRATLGTSGSTLVFNVPSALAANTQIGTLVQQQYASTGIPSTEFSIAAEAWKVVNNRPSGTNKVAPLNLQFVDGVTPFPTQGNNSLVTTLLAANINLVGTGAAGGVSNTIIRGGHALDGKPINYWYSVDWVQINTGLDLTNYLINGANNPANPVYYNQAGINGGQTVLAGTMSNGVTYGLVLNNVKITMLNAADLAVALNSGTFAAFTQVNAEPFPDYVAENPSDYGTGTYNGYTIEYTPLVGFESITINVIVSQFAA